MHQFDVFARRAVGALALGATVGLAGCSKPEAPLPAHIVTQRTPRHQRLPGTHVYLVPPAGAKPLLQQHALWKSEREFVQVVELPDSSFAAYVANVKRELSQAKDLSLKDLQQTTFNGQPAVFLRQPYRGGLGLESALLAYGDSAHVTLLVGVYSKLDGEARQRVEQTLLTAYANPRLAISLTEDLGYRIDLADNRFGVAGRDGRWAVYTPNGQPLGNNSAPAFRVTLLPATAETTPVQDAGLAIIRQYREQADVRNVQEANTEMNGHFAYENVLTYAVGGREGKALVLLISTPQGVVVFDGQAFGEDPYAHLKEFVRIAKAIRITAPPAA